MTHPIRQGECVCVLAARRGVPWRTIWDAPENDPLREADRHPNVLLPGDPLFVPEPVIEAVSLATGRKHRVVVKGLLATIHITLVAHLEPLANEPWVIEYGDTTIEGSSDGEGKLEAKLPAQLMHATLKLPDRRLRYHLQLGALDPIDTLSGARGRLCNLGLATGERGDEASTLAAIAGFQRTQALDESGELDDATISALRDEYGI
ncbi:hypothetical protein ACNOYE_25960 [Nannocystaceae bacterium ST9]